jgi:hypothetical protein
MPGEEILAKSLQYLALPHIQFSTLSGFGNSSIFFKYNTVRPTVFLDEMLFTVYCIALYSVLHLFIYLFKMPYTIQ